MPTTNHPSADREVQQTHDHRRPPTTVTCGHQEARGGDAGESHRRLNLTWCRRYRRTLSYRGIGHARALEARILALGGLNRGVITRQDDIDLATGEIRRTPCRRAKSRRLVLLVVLLLWSGGSFAQTEPANNTQLSKELVNPVTRHITLPLRYEAEFQDGPYKATKSTFELDQAVVPFRLNDDWALITRTKLPAIIEPPQKRGEHWSSGLGNGYTTFFLSPEHDKGFYWGAGPVLYYPSAANSAIGVHRWGSGPSAAFVVQDESPWVFGAVATTSGPSAAMPTQRTGPTAFC
jgi:hypothetical protein